MDRTDPIVDIAFPIQGQKLPYDHGYSLYSALSDRVPQLHQNQSLGIFQIPTTSTGDGMGVLQKDATLKLRAPSSLYPTLVQLAGTNLDVDGHRIGVGVPSAHPLRPGPRAWARLVVIKGYTQPEPFREAAERQLESMSIDGNIQVEGRNVVRVKDQSIVGFQLTVTDLSSGDCLQLQREGIGGKRRMGCGLFEPREDT